MGILLSRFRKKGSTLEALEKLENEIKEIEENKSYAQTRQKKVSKYLYLYSVGMGLICCIIIYFQFSSMIQDKLPYLILLALSPLVLLLINKVISWYYVKIIIKSQTKLIEMKKEKKRILDEVMDKETYNVAKQILDKYSTDVPKPNELKKRIVSVQNSSSTHHSQQQIPRNQPQSPHLNTPFKNTGAIVPMSRAGSSAPLKRFPAPAIQFPAPIIPLQRSYLDKMVEYLIGDGPNNRFALICSQCHSHNGMALKEEFEYISFKCCYCFFYNPARKIRPEAPKLEKPTVVKNENDSETGSGSGSNSDSEECIGNGNSDFSNQDVECRVKNDDKSVEDVQVSHTIKTESTDEAEKDQNLEKEEFIDEPKSENSESLKELPQDLNV